MKKTKVVCVGEALIDRLRNRSDYEFTDFLGGAPANVACSLSKLKIDVSFIGCLGSDKFGKKFIDKFVELDVNLDFLQLNNNLPTRIVKVDRDDSGERYFSGFDALAEKVFADETLNKFYLEKDINSLEKLLLETKYLVTGTNVISSPKSAQAIYFLIKKARNFDVKIVIDLNWREVFWNYSIFSSNIDQDVRVNLIKDFVNQADILKLAKDEAVLFFENENPKKISEAISNTPDVIVTDGAKPIKWFINGIQGNTEVFNSSEIVDTTGAGDAFLSGLISQLIKFTQPMTELEMKNCVAFASVCGLLTCLGEGAIEPQPNYEKINQFLGSHIL